LDWEAALGEPFTGLYADRTAGRDRHHRDPGGHRSRSSPKPREKARQASCASILKQWAWPACSSADYDETFPISVYRAATGQIGLYYDVQQPYMKNKQVMVCPSDKAPLRHTTLEAAFGGQMLARPWDASYTANLAVFEDGPNNPLSGQSQAPINLAEIPYPSENTLWYDGNLTAQFRSPSDARHNDIANAVFIDGHVKGIACTPLAQTYNDIQGTQRKFFIVGPAAGPYATTGVPSGYPGQAELWGIVLENHTIGILR